VQFADVDGDGDTDVVASGKGAEDLDILDRKPGSFLRFRFDTAAPVGQFVVRDFDGNELPDIAYVEQDLVEQRLQIAYGTTDQFLPGVNVGTFSKIRSIVPAQIPDSTDPDLLIADLAVLFEEQVFDEVTFDVTIVPAITLLHGSPQRTMLAFFDPRSPPLAPQSQFRGVVAGSFSGPNSNGNDVLAVEQAGTLTRLYLSVGATNGELQSQDESDAANVADCKGGSGVVAQRVVHRRRTSRVVDREQPRRGDRDRWQSLGRHLRSRNLGSGTAMHDGGGRTRSWRRRAPVRKLQRIVLGAARPHVDQSRAGLARRSARDGCGQPVHVRRGRGAGLSGPERAFGGLRRWSGRRPASMPESRASRVRVGSIRPIPRRPTSSCCVAPTTASRTPCSGSRSMVTCSATPSSSSTS
jgi:hypothetical protein